MSVSRNYFYILTLLLFTVLPQNVKGNVRDQQNPDGLARNDYLLRKNVVKVEAIERGQASLQCDLSTTQNNDRVQLVVWYRNENSPIFSYDMRNRTSKQPVVWRDTALSSRINFFINSRVATLILSNVSEKDADIYRCRIDYTVSRTKNQRVALEIIVPPQKMTVIDEKGHNLSLTAGPYDENGPMVLKCVVIGGKPPPEIVWLRNNVPMESTKLYSGFPNAETVQLTVRKLLRSNLHDSFTCRASNSNLSPPLQKTVKVDIYLGPISVKIANNTQLSAQKKYDIVCHTYGSKPPAKLIWLIDNREVDPKRFTFNQTDATDGNSSFSILSFSPTREENGLSLTCRAFNTFLPRAVLEDTIKLNVSYLPQSTINLGTSLRAEYIKEGQDVYFECAVNANPGSTRLIWLHNNNTLQHDKRSGILVSNNALVLQKISKYQEGNYSCVASNVEGDGESNIFNLKIMYKPVCKANQQRVYGVARRETAKILCEVESHPPPESFRWSFNNSAETIDILPTRIRTSTNKFLSVLTYTPLHNEYDYGTALCWAANAAGKQSEPCVFHIVTAGKPDRPHNCTITNASSYSVEVKCVEGFDGGLPQTAWLEVYDQVSSALLANFSSKFPTLQAENLEAGKLLKIVVYAANSKGRSDPVVLEGYTLMSAEKQLVLSMDVQNRLEIMPWLGAIIGFVIILIILSLAAVVIIKLNACRKQMKLTVFSVDNSKINPAPQKRPNGRDFLEKDENNPDIIPIYTSKHQLSSNNSSQDSPHENIFTPLTEAVLAKNREQEFYELNYAELCLVPSDYLQNSKLIPNKKREDRVLYAEIEHQEQNLPLSKPLSGGSGRPLIPSGKLKNRYKEVVTTKGPSMGYHQESCV